MENRNLAILYEIKKNTYYVINDKRIIEEKIFIRLRAISVCGVESSKTNSLLPPILFALNVKLVKKSEIHETFRVRLKVRT